MEIDFPPIDAVIVLLIVGVISLVMGVLLFKDYLAKNSENPFHALWGTSFLVLFVSGVLIILFNFEILDNEAVAVVAALIPACFAIGLLYAMCEKKNRGRYYSLYALVMIVLIAVFKYTDSLSDNAAYVIMAIHVPSGLIMVLWPAMGVQKGVVENSAYFFSLGGLFMSLGGVLLAFVAVDSPILEKEDIWIVLPYLLAVVGVLLVLGIMLPSQWKVPHPFTKAEEK